MLSVKEIMDPVAEDVKLFEKHFRNAMQSNTPLLDKITHYIVKRKGKQLRPLFIFLTAKMCGEISESTYTAASLIELLHTATLVHDDVVDDANLRRGFFSLNALWKNKIAVLVGDFLLSRGLLMAVENKEYNLLGIVSAAVKEMSEGELLQIEKSRNLDIDEEIYFDIIRQKTASLISACCESGALSSGAKKKEIQLMKQFGEKVGIAFQIKDDLFDFGNGKNIGKPTGIDIKEKKLTLPLIHALNQSSRKDRRRIINTIKRHHDKPKKVREVIDFVIHSDGIKYSEQKMNEYKNEALDILESFEDNEAKTSLRGLVDYTINRKK